MLAVHLACQISKKGSEYRNERRTKFKRLLTTKPNNIILKC